MDRIQYELEQNRKNNKPKILNQDAIDGKHLNNVQSEEYLNYLNSPKWKQIRKEALVLYESCVLCGAKKQLDVHHRSYKNFGNETIVKDLIVLCERCHAKYHYWKNGKKFFNRKKRKRNKKKLVIWSS